MQYPGIPQTSCNGGRPPVKVSKHLLITLWLLATPESMRSVADRFGVSKSTTFQVFYRVCDMLKGYLAAKLITWPIGERLQDITKEFEDMRGMPSALDGSHIPIKAPVLCPDNYIRFSFCYSPGSM